MPSSACNKNDRCTPPPRPLSYQIQPRARAAGEPTRHRLVIRLMHRWGDCWSRGGDPPAVFFFFNDTAPTEIYPLPLPDALPIWGGIAGGIVVDLVAAQEGFDGEDGAGAE